MFTLDINKIKNDIIDKLLDDLTSFATSDSERKMMKLDLEAKIKQNLLVTKTPYTDIEVNADNINDTMNSVYVDLLTTFGALNNMNEELTKYNISYTTYINYINSRIDEVNDMLEACRHSLTSIYMPAFHIERFRTSDKFDKTRYIQRDRYGTWLPSYTYCNFNEKEQHITLPLLRQDNSLRYDDKVDTAYVGTYYQLGDGFVDLKNNQTEIENCIDESESSFWSDTILSDAPLRVSFLDKKPEKLYLGDNYYYDVDNGAVCELEINFESVNTVNEITLNPFTKYPMRIVAIRYKQTDDQDEELHEIVYPDNKQTMLRDRFTKTQISYKFQDILCKKIYILFTQEHYLRKTYVYNPIEVYKSDMWFNSKNDRRPKVLNAQFKPNYFDRTVDSAMWKNVNDKVLATSSQDLSDIIVGDKKQNRKVIKYEYEYGFYNIGCYNNHYDRTGFYISKPIKPGTNIKQVKIKTKEAHQLDSLNHRVTDIEYYVTGSESPDWSDWYPLLPDGRKTIESELLMITGGTFAYLRFETDNITCVMKNGEPIPYTSSEDFKKDTLSTDVVFDIHERTGHIWAIRIPNYDYDAVYSVKYEPIDGSDVLDLSKKISTSIETFEGKNKNSFKLKNEPFVDSTTNYCSIKMSDLSRNTNGMEVELENVTDITNQALGYKNFDKGTNKYQFYVYKDTVYFNKPIPNDYVIDVSYRHLISQIKVKALFRRNSTKDGWLTPILDEIKYDIETF
jgi:hypothetical protein